MSCCRKHRFSATSSAFGLRSAAIAHVIHRITHPSRYCRRSGSVPFHPTRREVPRMRFLRPTTGWHQTVVQYILESEAVYGVFQPMRLEEDGQGGRTRVADGEPLRDYFP